MKIGEELTIFIVVYGSLCAALACWTDRTLDFWLTYWKGTPVDVNWWLSLLVTLVASPIIFATNVISEVMRCCI